MADYRFRTHWRVRGSIETVSAILNRPEDLPRWWPAVYLAAEIVEPAGPDGLGKVIDLHTKGYLPYTLRWTFRVTRNEPPRHFGLEAWGDFVGDGLWTLRQDGPFADIQYDWAVRAEKPLLRMLSPILRPVFSANHRWAMAVGEESLRLELARRQPEPASATISAPPAATPDRAWPWLLRALRDLVPAD